MEISNLPVGKGRTTILVRLAHARCLTAFPDLATMIRDGEFVHRIAHIAKSKDLVRNCPALRLALLAAVEKDLIAWETDTLEDVRRIVLETAAASNIQLSPSNRGFEFLPDFIIFAQSQGFIPHHGWSDTDLLRAHDFKLALRAEGLDEHASQRDFRFVVHFVIWARLHAVARGVPKDHEIERFAEHECRCHLRCHPTTPTGQIARRLALRRWRRFLEDKPILTQHGNVRRENRKPPAPLTPSVAAFEEYLLKERGFTPATIASYINDIRLWHPRLGEDASRYTARSIRRLCREEFERRAPGAQTRFLSVLRGYLRFRAEREECDRTLLGAIVSRPTYTQGTIPKTKPFAVLRGYIAACDTETAPGLRARAVMSLLLETGIRAKEAGCLKLDDIDWQKGEFLIDGKGRQCESMPLPESAGNAILDWIEKGRPACDNPYVFVRLRRPYQSLNLNSGVSTLVQDELRKQGVRRSGAAHVFRHSFARQHLKGGLTLPQIGRLLRHRIVDTTQIYAKVDDKMLAALAQDWPEEPA